MIINRRSVRVAVLVASAATAACGGGSETTSPAVTPAASAAPSSAPVTASAAPAPSAAPAASAAATPPPAPTTPSPFADVSFYVNPDFVAQVEKTAKATPADAAAIRKVEAFPTAVWLDSIARAKTIGKTLDDAEAQAKKSGKPTMVLFAVYDLPDRDCSATASAGELDAKTGEQKYKDQFIAPIAAEFKKHPSLRIATILEPDSLPNIATNLESSAKCKEADPIYRHSIAAAIKALQLPNVSIYLDAAHAGWLGWDANREKIAKIFKSVLDDAGGADKIRGFATNVSNYDPPTAGDSKPFDEMTYTQKLSESLAKEGITGKGFIIDTSRSGKPGVRTKGGSWCNVTGAGLGERPQASPAPGIDAYWWVKPPGESDGSSDPKSKGFDKGCEGGDASPGAPQAGKWFSTYFVQLVKNANPPL
jgi:cellulose 1,4-beta-cellobiosidase